MSKKTGRVDGDGKDDFPDDGSDGEGFEEIEVKRQNSTYSFRIKELLERMKIDELPTFTLFKYDHPTAGEQKSFIDRYDGDPPSEHDVGIKHGSGRYLLVMSLPNPDSDKNIGRAYRFRINQRYDQLRHESLSQFIPQGQQQVQPVVVNQGNGLMDAIAILERMVSALSPLFIRERDPDISKVLFENYRSTNEVLKGAQMEQMKLVREMISRSPEQSGDGSDVQVRDEESQPNILEQIMPLLNTWLPVLLGGGQKAQAVGALARSTPQFTAILQNKKELKSIVAYLDQSQGKEKTDIVLKNLKVKRP